MRFQLLLSLTAMVTLTHTMGIPTNENTADTLVGEVVVRPHYHHKFMLHC